MDTPGYITPIPAAPDADAPLFTPFKCPPTTFYSPNSHSCVLCPYPKVSSAMQTNVDQ
jgi:hypothetical protein